MGPSGERGEGWFTGLYATHYRDIVRYGMRRIADLDESVELAQEVFIVAWQRRTDVPRSELPWLYGVARKILANRWRSQRRQPSVTAFVDGAPYAEDPHHPESAVELVDLLTALLSLAESDQEILRLVAWEGLTVAETAIVLGCSRPTARVRLHRARQRLRTALDRGPKTVQADHTMRISERNSDGWTPASTGASRPG